MDYYTESSMDTFLYQNQRSISVRSKLLLLHFVMQGLRVLRDADVVHMDLKEHNILVGRGMIPRISDFGESFIKKDTLTARPDERTTKGHTFPYCAP